MKKACLRMLPLLAALLGGCGDPAPSTTLAPDQPPLPDLSKMSKEEVGQAHQQASAGGSDRGAAPGASAPADHGGAPADRGG